MTRTHNLTHGWTATLHTGDDCHLAAHDNEHGEELVFEHATTGQRIDLCGPSLKLLREICRAA